MISEAGRTCAKAKGGRGQQEMGPQVGLTSVTRTCAEESGVDLLWQGDSGGKRKIIGTGHQESQWGREGNWAKQFSDRTLA